jgi:4-hydroxy-3-polyprenylbenzoate decarboxylase
MAQIAEMGGILLPPIMAFYHRPKSVQDMVDHCVGKVLDVLKIPHSLYARWEGPKKK